MIDRYQALEECRDAVTWFAVASLGGVGVRHLLELCVWPKHVARMPLAVLHLLLLVFRCMPWPALSLLVSSGEVRNRRIARRLARS